MPLLTPPQPDILRIWHYKRLDRKLRQERHLPPLENEDDLPDPALDPNFTHVLTEKQQAELKIGQLFLEMRSRDYGLTRYYPLQTKSGS